MHLSTFKQLADCVLRSSSEKENNVSLSRWGTNSMSEDWYSKAIEYASKKAEESTKDRLLLCSQTYLL